MGSTDVHFIPYADLTRRSSKQAYNPARSSNTQHRHASASASHVAPSFKYLCTLNGGLLPPARRPTKQQAKQASVAMKFVFVLDTSSIVASLLRHHGSICVQFACGCPVGRRGCPVRSVGQLQLPREHGHQISEVTLCTDTKETRCVQQTMVWSTVCPLGGPMITCLLYPAAVCNTQHPRPRLKHALRCNPRHHASGSVPQPTTYNQPSKHLECMNPHEKRRGP